MWATSAQRQCFFNLSSVECPEATIDHDSAGGPKTRMTLTSFHSGNIQVVDVMPGVSCEEEPINIAKDIGISIVSSKRIS